MSKKNICVVMIVVTIVSLLSIFIGLMTMLIDEKESLSDYNYTISTSDDYTENGIIETNYYKVTDAEREMLAKIVTLESSICSTECQRDVCSVIFNRLDSGKWKRI